MTKEDVQIGGTYRVKVRNKLVTVRIDSAVSPRGWDATNLDTGRPIRIKSAQRLRAAVGETRSAPAQPTSQTQHIAAVRSQKRSALDAAAQVLAQGQPMNAKQLIEAMAAQGLWTSPGGATPHATLYAAMAREIATKGRNARFQKIGKGLFAAKA
ncbi:MAG: winged helix-turn-helix domain-containing protein [Bacteroidales bacterium]|nr:winged helix-turn-helix domain-containing protein [Bacteroidales bacterium]